MQAANGCFQRTKRDGRVAVIFRDDVARFGANQTLIRISWIGSAPDWIVPAHRLSLTQLQFFNGNLQSAVIAFFNQLGLIIADVRNSAKGVAGAILQAETVDGSFNHYAVASELLVKSNRSAGDSQSYLIG